MRRSEMEAAVQQFASRDILEPFRRQTPAAEAMQRQLREQPGSVGEDMHRRMRIPSTAVAALSRAIESQVAAGLVRRAVISLEPRAESATDMAEWEFSEVAHGSF